ncbi:MAG: hypothetical protein JNM78_18255 [Cyclobacteriaceae bacterium]|nr:hypothetical protein [Cyclobacteriaceae bacterium]
MTASTENKKPYVNPILLGLTYIILIASILSALTALVHSWSSEKETDNPANTTKLLLFIIVGIGAYSFKTSLTKKHDEWDYRQTIKIIEEKELCIDDQFIFSRIYTNTDNPETYLFYYIISNGTLYQVHPNEDEKYRKDYLGVGSSIQAKIINEDDQLKIFTYTLLNKVAQTRHLNNNYEVEIITEKYFGNLPYSTKSQFTTDFPNLKTDLSSKQRIAQTFHIEFDGARLYNVKEENRDIFSIRINHRFIRVSMEYFLQCKIGDIANLTQYNTKSIS